MTSEDYKDFCRENADLRDEEREENARFHFRSLDRAQGIPEQEEENE